MRKLVLAVLSMLLFFSLTVNGSGAYLSDGAWVSANIATDPDNVYFLFLISPEGASFVSGDYASITSTGCNENFKTEISIYRPAAHQKPLQFNLGTIANKSEWPMDVLVEFDGLWPSQGGSGKVPLPFEIRLEGNESSLFQATFDYNITPGTPDKPKGGGEYVCSIKFTLTFYPPDGLPYSTEILLQDRAIVYLIRQ